MNNRKILTFFLTLSFLLISLPISAVTSPDSEKNINGTLTNVEPDSYFTINLIDNEMLNKIRSEPGEHSQILKVEPGIVIGLITPTTLYLRADMNEEDFLKKNNSGLSMDDISRHLLSITFGRDNSNITRFKSDLDYKFFFTDQYTKDDIDRVLQFSKMFNSISNIAKIEDEEVELSFLPGTYEEIPYHYYKISIISPQILDDYIDKNGSDEFQLKKKNGSVIGTVTQDRMMLVDSLSSKERSYYMLRGILWSMGFHGETTELSDSFFYKGSMNTTFSDLDMMAIELLYGGRLANGITLEDAEKALNLKRIQTNKNI